MAQDGLSHRLNIFMSQIISTAQQGVGPTGFHKIDCSARTTAQNKIRMLATLPH
jgi:hypothetical protein